MFLYGRVDDWANLNPDEPEPFEKPLVFLSRDMEVILAQRYNTDVPKDEAAERDTSEWKQRLEGLLERLMWSFFDSQGETEGLTNMCGAGNSIPAVITLDNNKFPALMDPEITIAERVRILYKLANTIVHEVTHAIVASRIGNYVPGSFDKHRNNERVDYFHDVLVDFEGQAEAGLHMEQACFGGIQHSILFGLPLTSMLHDSPNGMALDQYGYVPGPWSEDGFVFRSSFLQSSYVSRLLSEAWWQDPDLPARSLNYFHKTSTFTTDAIKVDDYEILWDPPTAHEPDASDPYYGPNKRDFDSYKERAELQANIRAGWYDTEFSYWLMTPWRYSRYVLHVSDFAQSFAEKDEVKCALIAEELVRATIYWTNPDHYWDNFPQHEYDLEMVYIYHCIGLLMMASLPIRRVDKRKDRLNLEFRYDMVPSKERLAAGLAADEDDTFVLLMQTPKRPSMHAPPSQFFDHLNHRGEIKEGFTQFDYLENAFAVVKLVSSGTVTHLSWVRAFVQAHDAILANRQQIRRENGQWHTECWATQWFFRVPPYTKYMGRMENGRPREMRYTQDGERIEYVDGDP